MIPPLVSAFGSPSCDRQLPYRSCERSLPLFFCPACRQEPDSWKTLRWQGICRKIYNLLTGVQHTSVIVTLKKKICYSIIWQFMSTVVKCQGRWKDLRDQFSRKTLQPRSGSAAGPQKEWKYTQALSFLIPHLQPRRYSANTERQWWLTDSQHTILHIAQVLK